MTEEGWGRGFELGPEGATPELVDKLVADMRTRQRDALALHRALRGSKSTASTSRLAYRCSTDERHCLLLDVFETPQGLALYFPPFKLSPEQNRHSHPQARATRTTDGENHWVERVEMLAAFGTVLTPWVTCDHVLNRPLPVAEIEKDLKQHAGSVRYID